MESASSKSLASCGSMVQVNLLGYLGRYLLGGLLHVLGVLVRQAVLRQYGVHLHVVVACRAEHVLHLARDALVFGIGPLRDLHHGLVAALRPLELLLGYYDVARVQGGWHHEEGHVLLHAQLAHEGVLGVLEYLYDLRLLDVVAAACHYGHPHAVAPERRHRVALGHEERRAAVVGAECVLAVGLAHERALLHLSLGVELV